MMPADNRELPAGVQLEGHYSHSLSEAFALAGEEIGQILSGKSLNATRSRVPNGRTELRAAAQDLCYNALRGYGVVDVAIERLLDKPLNDTSLHGLLLATLAELMNQPHSAHTIVNQGVEAASRLGQPRAKGLVNAVLRNFLRRSTVLLQEIERGDTARYRHPQWWIDALRVAYPSDWESILVESNRHPPMTLRVNRRRISVEDYLEKLRDSGVAARPLGVEAVMLDRPCRVDRLPGFSEGEVSVQDAGAQRAAYLLGVQDGARVLDACAAPGGKTGHILELADCELWAVDNDKVRTRRIAENLSRLHVAAKIVVGDCREPEKFSQGCMFDRILLDAPCSASGVSRRHPDIRWLRRAGDIAEFARTQSLMLNALWRVLAPGGKLLYATCSVFPEENGEQVDAFLARQPGAIVLPLPDTISGQMLPGSEHDGFFYALIEKRD